MGEICLKTNSWGGGGGGGGGVGKWVKYASKLTHTPPPPFSLSKTPPHIMKISRLTPPPPLKKKFPPIDSLIPSLLIGFLPPIQTSLQMTLRRISKSHLKSHQNHWTLSLCRLRMNWEIPHLLQHLWH